MQHKAMLTEFPHVSVNISNTFKKETWLVERLPVYSPCLSLEFLADVSHVSSCSAFSCDLLV